MTSVTIYELQDGAQMVMCGVLPSTANVTFGQLVARKLTISVDDSMIERIFKLAETRSINLDTVATETAS